MEGFNVEGPPRHRRIVARCSVPFTGQGNAVNHRLNDGRGCRCRHRRVGPEVLQIGRQIEVDGTVDVGEVDLEQHVPVLVVAAVLVQAVPPVPIAAFSDVERLPSSVKTGVVGVGGFERNEGLAGLDQPLPTEAFFLFSGPRSKGSVDP